MHLPDPDEHAPREPDPDDIAALRARLLVGRADRPARARAADHLDPGEPPSRGHVAWAVTARSVVVGVVVTVAVAAALVVRALGASPGEIVLLPATSASAAGEDAGASAHAGAASDGGAGTMPRDDPSAAGNAASPEPSGPVVHVVGQVVDPGVVRLAAGARVVDAIEAAGGLRKDADVTHVNLARPVSDGEQVVVPRQGEDPPPAADPGAVTTSPRAPAASSRVDLNSADVAALDALPGIGPVLAQRIVDHREQHGPFQDVASLSDVTGIGPALQKRLADLVSVG